MKTTIEIMRSGTFKLGYLQISEKKNQPPQPIEIWCYKGYYYKLTKAKIRVYCKWIGYKKFNPLLLSWLEDSKNIYRDKSKLFPINKNQQVQKQKQK